MSTFFCPTDADRERLLELEAHLRGARLATFAALGAGLAVMAPWISWKPVPFCVVLLVVYETLLRRRLERSLHPAALVLTGFVLTTTMIAAAAIVSGGPASAILPWLVIPIVSLAGRFDTRGVWTGALLALVALGAVTATDLDAFAADPAQVIALVPLIVSVGLFSVAMMRAERVQRTASALDPLTGLLNRTSLEHRFAELGAQARLTGDPVAVLALDLDHFKAINDTHGHACGDEVLRQVAASIRGQLRSFELVYRMGGEEFLVVLPGVDVGRAGEIAERLRRGLEDLHPEGVAVTASIGVSAGSGAGVDLDALYEAADAALYAAKRAGRNRVQVAEGPADLRLAA